MRTTISNIQTLGTKLFALSLCLIAFGAKAATLTVTSDSDNGPGSLRDAVASANPGDTLNFLLTGTITLTNGTITINKDLTITGPGADQLTVIGLTDSSNGIEGVTNGTPFSISSNSIVTINGLTLSGETYGNGGGVNNSGTLNICNCVVSNCSAVGLGSDGGGIFSSGDMVLSGCVVGDCVAGNGLSNYAIKNEGGGIYNSGKMLLKGSDMINNWSDNNGAGVFNLGSMTLLNCTLSGNVAVENGCGIQNEGSMVLGGCVISNNIGEGGQGSSGLGIANGVFSTNCVIVLTNSTIAWNFTRGKPGAQGGHGDSFWRDKGLG